MEIVQKNNLTTMLGIKLKLMNKDLGCIEDINSILKLEELSLQESELLNDIIDTYFQETCIDDFDFVKKILNEINIANRDYLLAKYESIHVLYKPEKYNLTDYIFDTLDKKFTDITNEQEFTLYQIISRLSIIEGSPEIIKLTIDKIQSL